MPEPSRAQPPGSIELVTAAVSTAHRAAVPTPAGDAHAAESAALAGRTRLAVVVLLAVFGLLCAHGLFRDSPTVDEFAHLPAGYHALRTGTFDLFPLNPPLIKVMSALPLLFLHPEIDTTTPPRNTGWYPWEFATRFMEANRAGFDRIFLFGRLPVVALGMLLAWLVFAWARALYGDEAGLTALVFAVFCPSLVAHAHLATVDVGFAAMVVLALWTLQRFVQEPSVGRLLQCGGALGLCELSKHTALLLYPIFAILAAVALWRGERFPLFARSGRGVASSLLALGAIFAVSLAVLDAGYLFQGVGSPLGEHHFASAGLRALAARLPSWLPVPLPRAWLAGFDALQRINETGEFPEYLFGRWSRQGSLFYYLATVVFKTPLPLLAAFVAAPFVRRGSGAGRGEYFLWLPALLLLAAFSVGSKVHYGIRYVLPVLPLLMIYAARLVPGLRGARRALRVGAAALLLAYPLSIVLVTPDTIDYFNLLAGGEPDRILLDSNLDWGQGLERLRTFMDREGLGTIPLAYFGHVDPAIYGIAATTPVAGQAGLVAVSANFLHGYPYVTFSDGHMTPVPENAYAWIAAGERVADLGGGMLIYRSAPRAPPP